MSKGYTDFLKLCTQMKSEQDFENLFNLFLTLEEQEILASRTEIVKALLGEQITQREIARVRGVSISQITRGSNALKIVPPTFKKTLKSFFGWR